MGFTISDGGFFLALIITILISLGAIVLFFLLTAARQARDGVVQDEGDDPDIIA